MKKRVVAYCRVSTGKEEQKTSFANQQSYFRDKVANNEDYEWAELPTNKNGIYADEGISGTKLSRPCFDQMLKDAGLRQVVSKETGKLIDSYEIESEPLFDLILVKDTSRLARNVSIDPILKTLADNNVYVRFEDIQKSTENSDEFSGIQIFLSIAEQESRTKSHNVRIGYEQGVKQGKIYVGGKIYGYDYIKIDKNNPDNGNRLVINPEEAKVVKLIFDLYTNNNMGHYQICNELARLGYRNTKGNKFTRSTIRRILINKRYIGENVPYSHVKKSLFSVKPNEAHLEEVRQQAKDASEQLEKRGIVRIERIIEPEQFNKAQEILVSNRKAYNNNCTYHGTTLYARKIKCAICGRYFTAQTRKYSSDKKEMIRYYACTSKMLKDPDKGIFDCGNKSISENYITDHLLSKQFYDMQIENFEEMIDDCQNACDYLEQAKKANYTEQYESISNEVKMLNEEFERLKNLYRKGDYTEEEYDAESRILKETISTKTEVLNVLQDPINHIVEYQKNIKKIQSDLKAVVKEMKEDCDSGRSLNRNVRDALDYIDCIYVKNNTKDRLSFVYKTSVNMSNLYMYLDSVVNQFVDCMPKTKRSKTLKECVAELQVKGINIHTGKIDNS